MNRYDWMDFDLAKAKSGMLIGVPNNADFSIPVSTDDDEETTSVVESAEPATSEGETTEPSAPEGESAEPAEPEGEEGETGGEGHPTGLFDPSDLTYCGVMSGVSPYPFYVVGLGGNEVLFDGSGRITRCLTHPGLVGKMLYVVDVWLAPTQDTRAEDESGVVLEELEVRDHFAIAALQGMIGSIPRADMLSDGSMLCYASAAYRWAQAMMIVAAKSRTVQEGGSEGGSEGSEGSEGGSEGGGGGGE